MTPRKRSAGAIDEDGSEDELPLYSPCFSLFPEADLVVQTSDEVLFATRAMYLQAASSVLDDLLSIPIRRRVHEKKDGHPLLKVDEESAEWEVFLRYAQRDRLLDASGKLPQPTWDALLLVDKMTEKYDSPNLARLIFGDQLSRFLGDPSTKTSPDAEGGSSPAVFALAAIHGLEDLARQALRCHHYRGLNDADVQIFKHKDSTKPAKLTKGWRPKGLGDLSIDLISRMPPQSIQRYSQLRDKVLMTPGYSWLKAGNDLRVSLYMLPFLQNTTSDYLPPRIWQL